MRLGEPESIRLRGHDIKIWIQSTTIDRQCFHRVFIATPALHKLRDSNWRAVQELGEILRLTSLFTGVNLDCYLPEKAQVFAHLFRQVQLERDYCDGSLWKVDTLNQLLMHWLACKGFQKDDDLIILEKLAGSLVIGVCMLTHVSPHRNAKFAPETTGSRTSTRNGKQDPR